MKIRFILFLIAYQFQIFSQGLETDEFDILKETAHLPHANSDWKYNQSIGASINYLPKDWLESAYSLPMMYYKSNFHLKRGFVLNSDVKTILAATDIAIGPSWNIDLSEKLFFGIGYQTSFGLGMLYDLGYDNTLTVFGHRPYLKFGYIWEDLAFTIKGGVDFSNKINFDAGSTNLSGNMESLNGYNFSIFMEQRMFKNKSYSMGFTMSYLKFHILGWPAFTYTKNMDYVPELTALFNF